MTLKNNRLLYSSGTACIVSVGTEGTVSGNEFALNGSGLAVSGPVTVTKNAMTNNSGFGIAVESGPATLTKNAVVANRGRGIVLAPFVDVTISANNIYGNGIAGGNVGLEAFTGFAISAAGNYWGAASGPGPDPADEVDELMPGLVTTPPVADSEIKVRLPPLPLGPARA